MKKWVKFAVAGVVIVGVVAYLMFTGLDEHSIYYLEVTELLENPAKFDSKGTRLSGNVVEDSVLKDTMNTKLLKFRIEDSLGASMPVEYAGVVPDAFEEGVTVILEGRYDIENKLFMAKTLMAKCPSKYETEDPANHDVSLK